MNYNEMMAILCQVANSKMHREVKDRAKLIYDHLEVAPETAHLYVDFVKGCKKIMSEEQSLDWKPIEDFVSKLFNISSENIKVVNMSDTAQSVEQKIPEINVVTQTIHSALVKINGFNVKAEADGKMLVESKCEYTEFFEPMIIIENVAKIQQRMLITFKEGYSWEKTKDGFIVLEERFEIEVK